VYNNFAGNESPVFHSVSSELP